MTTQPEALRLADDLDAWTLGKPTHHREAAAELRRLHDELAESQKWRDREEARAANAERERDIAEANYKELGAALRRLISYCNLLENRLMEADGEHPALQEAKEAYAKVEDV